jgi:hypothetical protein
MGRPLKLTPDVQGRIVQAIAAGNTRETAAAYAGINVATLYRWLAEAAAGANGIKREFHEAVKKAEADAVVTSVAIIRQAAHDSWQAAAWWLERRYPDDWARRERLEIKHLIETEAKRVADELGLPDSAEVVAEVERLLR